MPFGFDKEVPELVAEIEVLEGAFPALALCHWSRNPPEVAFVYGDPSGLIRHIVTEDGKLKENWRSFPLESPIQEVLTADLDNDGYQEIITYTAESRIYIWTMKSYNLLWDSTGEDLGTIQAIVVGNVDTDPEKELVLCSNNRIVYYDGVTYLREREGRDIIHPTCMVMGDVDADGNQEIVTNDGYVIDPVSLVVKWSTEEGFGYPIRLIDIDNDGVPEIIGEREGTVTFWDVQDRREIW